MPFPWPNSTPADFKAALPSCICNLALAGTVEDAFHFAGQHVALKCGMVTKPAIVLDIDDSALIGEPQRAQPSALKFYKLALSLGVKCFFVTARVEEVPSDREFTMKQLKDNGYTEFEKLYMAPRYTVAFSGIKAGFRKKIEEEGWNVLSNGGDQWADLVQRTGPASLSNLDLLDAIAKKRPILFFNSSECHCLCVKLPYA